MRIHEIPVASIQRKIIHGHPYYYIVESRRVNGRPRPVVVQYLGSPDTLLARLQNPQTQPLRARITQFGGVAALYDLARQLELVELIDEHVPKRRQGPSVGQYILVAAINRCLAPTSKLRMPEWLATTPLPRWLGLQPKQFSSPRFWDNMDLLGEAEIDVIGQSLSPRLMDVFHLDPACLLFDCTNFDTFIDTETDSQLPQRGHAKSKRTDLRIVGLALLVTADFHVPLFWKVYPGNQHDSVTFSAVLKELTGRYRNLARDCENITLVFDKGNNSARNQTILDLTGFHFVGSLVPSQFTDLLGIPMRKFHRLKEPRLESIQSFRLQRQLWGQSRTVVITFSPELQRKQIRGIEQQLGKKRRLLDDLQVRLRRSQQPGAKGKGFSRESLTKQVEQIRSGQHIGSLLEVDITDHKGVLKLAYRTDAAAYIRLKQKQLGKRILFTDHDDWTDEQIVLAYRAQSHVEDAFADMKDPYFLSWEPMFHWTDSKIRVHAFYCVLALTLGCLLQRRAFQQGIKLSLQQLFKTLGGIQEVTNISSAAGKPGYAGRPRLQTILTEMDSNQQALYRLFELDRYRKK
jgi:transposase